MTELIKRDNRHKSKIYQKGCPLHNTPMNILIRLYHKGGDWFVIKRLKTKPKRWRIVFAGTSNEAHDFYEALLRIDRTIVWRHKPLH